MSDLDSQFAFLLIQVDHFFFVCISLTGNWQSTSNDSKHSQQTFWLSDYSSVRGIFTLRLDFGYASNKPVKDMAISSHHIDNNEAFYYYFIIICMKKSTIKKIDHQDTNICVAIE